jgi:hypothetical protein
MRPTRPELPAFAVLLRLLERVYLAQGRRPAFEPT